MTTQHYKRFNLKLKNGPYPIVVRQSRRTWAHIQEVYLRHFPDASTDDLWATLDTFDFNDVFFRVAEDGTEFQLRRKADKYTGEGNE